MARKPTVTAEEAGEASQALRKFWRAGRESLRRLRKVRESDPDAYRHGTKQAFLSAEAAKYGYNPDTLKKGWRVAEEYAESDIDKLCGLIEHHQARFGPTHLIRLLTVKGRKRRDALAREAIKGRWGVIRLEQAILRQRRRRPLVGRQPHPPADPAERRVVLEGLCLKWVRWCDAASADLPEDLRKLVEAATRAVRRVQAAVAGELQGQNAGAGRGKKRP